ncbi:hypothetical protein [Breoghania sp. L-A4]|uniref:hypothetical protein n=1 Tax=Breoghania sp. L-A4 TaxID=2304600 RepID=UPI0013C29EB1|nr:hypothetical protein [Breoghania sp. L-A4]
MLILALSVCLAQAPETCKNVHLPFFTTNIPVKECVRYGEPEIDRWARKHPEWTIKDSACLPSMSQEQPA